MVWRGIEITSSEGSAEACVLRAGDLMCSPSGGGGAPGKGGGCFIRPCLAMALRVQCLVFSVWYWCLVSSLHCLLSTVYCLLSGVQ